MDTLDCSKCQFPFDCTQNPICPLQLGRAAKDITSTLETGLQNVAENLEGAFVTLGEPGTTDRTGWVSRVTCHVMSLVTSDVLRRCVTRTASYSSDRDPSSLLKSPPAPSSPASSSANGEFEGSERERFFESGTQVCALQ